MEYSAEEWHEAIKDRRNEIQRHTNEGRTDLAWEIFSKATEEMMIEDGKGGRPTRHEEKWPVQKVEMNKHSTTQLSILTRRLMALRRRRIQMEEQPENGGLKRNYERNKNN